MDAISMLKADHKTVDQLFKRFERAGNRAHVEKRAIVDRIIEELSVHAAVEEQLFYPTARAAIPKAESIALESLEEHHVVKWMLSELRTMSPEAERFDAKVTVLMENVRHHVKEEERELFPMVRGALGRHELNELGDAMAAAKKVAPTHPHPRASDTPPGNLVAGAVAGVADHVGDTVSGLAQGGVNAVGDIVATVLGRPKRRVSPTGSRAARNQAQRVRSEASDATEATVDVARKAKRTGVRTVRATKASARRGAKRTASTAKRGTKQTARAAKGGAKGTATSARRSSKRTVSTAKRAATTTGRAARTTARSTAKTAGRSASRTASTAKRAARRAA